MTETKLEKLLVYQYYRHDPNTGKTVNAGYNYHEFSRSSIRAYSKRIGAEYRFIDHEIPISPFYGIFLPFTEGWCHEYDAVCFIDSDILATVHAPSVFDNASRDSISIHLMTNAKPRGKNLSNEVEYFAKNGIFNSGVVVFPRSVYKSLIEHTKDLDVYHKSITEDHESIGSLDQAFMNFYIRDIAKTYHNLDKKFNYNLSRNSYSSRLSNYLVHYHRSFKRNIKEDYHNGAVIKEYSVIKIDNNEMYQPKTYCSPNHDANDYSKEYWNQKTLDHRTLRKTSKNENMLIRMYTDPYPIHDFFENAKTPDEILEEWFFEDNVKQETANQFYSNHIEPVINNKISMFYETKPSTKKIPQRYALLALDHQNRSSITRNRENIEIANYAKLIASRFNLPLIIKPHPITNDSNMIGYLLQDNFIVVRNNVCDLMDGADFIITGKSRVGFESLIRLKKTILFEETNYQEACHLFNGVEQACDYIANHTLDDNYIKRYLFKYFTDFLGYEYVINEA